MMKDPLKPAPSLLVKIGSALVHTEELQSPGGHPLDAAALETVLKDPEVLEWKKGMDAMGLLPKKRSES